MNHPRPHPQQNFQLPTWEQQYPHLAEAGWQGLTVMEIIDMVVERLVLIEAHLEELRGAYLHLEGRAPESITPYPTDLDFLK